MFVRLLCSVLIMNMFLGLIGCSQNDDKNRNNETEIDVITDFKKFSDMTREGTDKIDVTFDNHSGYPFYFTVQDQDDIAEIMEIILPLFGLADK